MYDGPSIGTEQEHLRHERSLSYPLNSLGSLVKFEPATIKSFTTEGNRCFIETIDGQQHYGVAVQTPVEMILFLYGELEKLTDIPCMLIYKVRPSDGYVIIGSIPYVKESEEDRLINNPFYL